MDQLFVDLIGKPRLNPSGKIISVIAENFSLIEDQAKFLKATFAIPSEKQLPLDEINKQLVQVGPLHADIRQQLEKANWTIVQCDEQLSSSPNNKCLCEHLNDIFSQTNSRSLIYINDASRLQLLLGHDRDWLKLLRLLHKWRTQDQHLIVVLYQQSQIQSFNTSLRDLEYISDGCVKTRSFKSCYLQSMWFRPVQLIKTLMPAKVETRYYTCKIGKSYWLNDLLCFYNRRQVTKGYDPDLSDVDGLNDEVSRGAKELDPDAVERALNRAFGFDEDETGPNLNAATLPYIKAQNPDQSKIFYYPDKDDDVDEDDPDYDLGI